MNSNAFELDVVQIRLVKNAPLYSDEKITSAEKAVELVGQELSDMDREVVAVVNCRTDLTPINVNFVSVGTLDRALFSPKDIVKSAILSNASAIILIHNHPSGNTTPSTADVCMTNKMEDLCDLIGITLADHVIVGGDDKDKYYSFSKNGLLQGKPNVAYVAENSMEYEGQMQKRGR